jgi:hypothetical protein
MACLESPSKLHSTAFFPQRKPDNFIRRGDRTHELDRFGFWADHGLLSLNPIRSGLPTIHELGLSNPGFSRIQNGRDALDRGAWIDGKDLVCFTQE